MEAEKGGRVGGGRKAGRAGVADRVPALVPNPPNRSSRRDFWNPLRVRKGAGHRTASDRPGSGLWAG